MHFVKQRYWLHVSPSGNISWKLAVLSQQHNSAMLLGFAKVWAINLKKYLSDYQ